MGPCIFTIVSRNYLHFARTLMESVRAVNPEIRRVVGLCDDAEGIESIPDGLFEILDVKDLNIPNLPDFMMRYSCIEANTAIKPFVIEALFDQGHDKVIYFDPDIRVYRPLDEMLGLLESHDILLTPHLTGPINDGKHPDEVTFLQSGTYNLGYIGLKNAPSARSLATWWQDRLMYDCVVDIPRGIFVDQKWMNLAPSLFANVHICRQPGWNTAYWNLDHRDVQDGNGGITVNGEPLLFFHFSGISPDAKIFSKHQNRFQMSDLNTTVQRLATDYCAALHTNGATGYSAMPYAFGHLANGARIPDFLRKLYRRHPELAEKWGSPITPEGEEAWLRYANATEEGYRVLSRAALAFYESRRDLREAFPDMAPGNELEYAHWFSNHGADQPDLSDIFVQQLRLRLRAAESPSLSAITSLPFSAALRQLAVWLYRRTYKLFWALRRLAYPFTSHNFRQKINEGMINRAYGRACRRPIRQRAIKKPRGLNVIGYLTAQSGVGQAGRLSLAAASAAGIPVATTDFTVGCASPSEEDDSAALADGSLYNINLFQINADQMPVLRSRLGESVYEGHYNIAFWYWELPEFPDQWLEAFEGLNEIWVASSFCQQAIAAKSPVPVVVMHPGVQVEVDPHFDPAAFGLEEDAFTFLAMADCLSHPERKNPLAAIEAYIRAFPEDDTSSTRLVVKLMNTEYNSETLDHIRRAAAQHASISLIEQNLRAGEIGALLKEVDCFVSLHRSEGFGLPLAEAMLLGTPVIGTGWSSNMEFMTEQNAYPVNYRLVAIEEDIGPYQAGQIWADPDIDHAAACMRRVVTDRDEAQRKAAQGQAQLQNHFSPQSAGEKMAQRLEVIQRRIG